MTAYEYNQTTSKIDGQKSRVKQLGKQHPQFQKEFEKLLEMLITIKGHAWSMDVKSERKKMAKLITEAVSGL